MAYFTKEVQNARQSFSVKIISYLFIHINIYEKNKHFARINIYTHYTICQIFDKKYHRLRSKYIKRLRYYTFFRMIRTAAIMALSNNIRRFTIT